MTHVQAILVLGVLLVPFCVMGCDPVTETPIDMMPQVVYIPPPPDLVLSWQRHEDNPMVVVCRAQVAGGAPMNGDPPYEIGWDFHYDGIHFNTMAAGSQVSFCYADPGEYTLACRVRDRIPDVQDPDRRPIIETIQVKAERAAVPSPPTVHTSWYLHAANPLTAVCHATVSDGVPLPVGLPYEIGWDFRYDGVNFNIMAAGEDASYSYPAVGEYTVACRIRDAIPDYLDPDNRPVIVTMKVTTQEPVIPDPPVVIISYTKNPDNPLAITCRAEVSGGYTQPGFPIYEIGWDFSYNGVQFKTEAAGDEVSVAYMSVGERTVACRVRDAIPDSMDPENRPVIETMNVVVP